MPKSKKDKIGATVPKKKMASESKKEPEIGRMDHGYVIGDAPAQTILRDREPISKGYVILPHTKPEEITPIDIGGDNPREDVLTTPTSRARAEGKITRSGKKKHTDHQWRKRSREPI